MGWGRKSPLLQGYPGCPISSAGASGEVHMRSECSLTSKFRPALSVLEAGSSQTSWSFLELRSKQTTK